MARKPSDIVSPNLRIREDLRRRLETAAAKNGVSINREMINRLEASFGQQSLLEFAELVRDLDVIDARLGEKFIHRNSLGDLMRNTEVLLVAINSQDPKAIATAAAQVKSTIATIDRIEQLKLRRMPANE